MCYRIDEPFIARHIHSTRTNAVGAICKWHGRAGGQTVIRAIDRSCAQQYRTAIARARIELVVKVHRNRAGHTTGVGKNGQACIAARDFVRAADSPVISSQERECGPRCTYRRGVDGDSCDF